MLDWQPTTFLLLTWELFLSPSQRLGRHLARNEESFSDPRKNICKWDNFSPFRSRIAELRWGGQLRAIVSSGKNYGWPKNIPKNCEKKNSDPRVRLWGVGGTESLGEVVIFKRVEDSSMPCQDLPASPTMQSLRRVRFSPFLITSPVKNPLHPLPSSHTKRAKRFLWKRRYNCFCSYSQMQDWGRICILSSVSQLFSKRSQRNDENGHFLSTEIGIVSHCFLFNWRSS